MQRIEQTGTTVADLAAEFGLRPDEMLELCEMFGVAASGPASPLTPDGIDVLRGVASGRIDHPPAPARPPGPSPTPVATTTGNSGFGGLLPHLPENGADVDAPPPAQPTAPASAPERRATATRPNRRQAGENLPEVHETSWWARNFRGRVGHDTYVPRWLRIVYLISVVLVLVVLWWLIRGGGGDDADGGALFTEAPDITIGSCFNADPGLWLDSAVVVSCLGPHAAQAVTVVTLEPAGRSYPELADLRSEGVVRCVDAARSAVTLQDHMAIDVSVPSVSRWREGDQRVLCSVVDRLGGSLIGSALEQ